MLLILSPAKSLNFDIKVHAKTLTDPAFLSDSKILVSELQKFSAAQISQLMKISDNLAQLNFERFQNFKTPFTITNSKPAIFVFDGDVYDGIDIEKYTQQDLDFAQQHLRILSGLYGVLRPLDLMQAYRLEMSTALKNGKNKNLYQFWQEKITNYFNEELKNDNEKIILNLASEEYFSAIDAKKINGKIINVIFKEKKGSDYKIVGIFAKKARGLMTDFVIKNKITKISKIKEFNIGGYKFMEKFSDENNFLFYKVA